jgi:hypothetical protein
VVRFVSLRSLNARMGAAWFRSLREGAPATGTKRLGAADGLGLDQAAGGGDFGRGRRTTRYVTAPATTMPIPTTQGTHDEAADSASAAWAVTVGDGVGVSLGSAVGVGVTVAVGVATGTSVGSGSGSGAAVGSGSGSGTDVGSGSGSGAAVGSGSGSGAAVGSGSGSGAVVGSGSAVGSGAGRVGSPVGSAVGSPVGSAVGKPLGSDVGRAVGSAVGIAMDPSAQPPSSAAPSTIVTPATARASLGMRRARG